MSAEQQQSSGRKQPLTAEEEKQQSQSNEPITLNRACEAVEIPSGRKVMLPAGTQVTITQSHGGTYTVMTDHGYLVGIARHDADALGRKVGTAPPNAQAVGVKRRADIEHLVWEQLKTCFDPEIPVNIVDLGLVYHCQVRSLSKGGKKVEVQFTLTAPTCGMGDWLKADIERKVRSVPGVEEVVVALVFEPPWDHSRMSEAVKQELGLI